MLYNFKYFPIKHIAPIDGKIVDSYCYKNKIFIGIVVRNYTNKYYSNEQGGWWRFIQSVKLGDYLISNKNNWVKVE